MRDPYDYGYSHDFAKSFTLEVASALIAGRNLRFNPNGDSVILKRLKEDVQAGKLTVTGGQVERAAVARWLVENGLTSAYEFDLDVTSTHDIDPDELPEELAAANIMLRAYKNHTPASSLTPKQWIIDRLERDYPHFSQEQRKRIATVANPDKSSGRRKRL